MTTTGFLAHRAHRLLGAALLSLALAHCGPGSNPDGGTNPDGSTNPDGNNPDGSPPPDGNVPISTINGTWRVVNSGTVEDIYSIWASGPNDVWAASAREQMHSTNGTTFTATRVDFTLRSVGGTGPNDVWFYGATIPPNGSAETPHPVFWHKTTGSTFMMSQPAALTNAQYYWLWARAPNDVWVVGSGTPAVARYDGTNWSAVTQGLMPMDTLFSVYGFAGNDVWAAGQRVYRWNGTTWAAQTLPGITMMEYSFGVWGSAPNDVWLVGAHIYSQRWNGSAWSEADTRLDSNLNAIWGAAPNDIWAVGDGGIIVHWNGREWEPGRQPMVMTPRTLRAIYGTSASDIWAAGENGTLLHYTVP